MAFSKKMDAKRAIAKFKARMEISKRLGDMPEANRQKAKIDKAVKNA